MEVGHLTTVISSLPNINAEISNKGNVTANISASLKSKVLTTPISITPSTKQQVFNIPDGFDGFSEITVAPIPSNYGKITYNGMTLKVE